MAGWIGVDLDGTLAHYDSWRGPDSIGLPIPSMVKRVESWIAEGREVRIFTARATDPRLIPPIKRWLKLHGLPEMRITNVKDFQMIELWDDRAVQVIHNTGRAVQPNTLDENHKPELIDPDAAESAVPEQPGHIEQEVAPTEAEVEAFRNAVKSRATNVDDSLLDALDAGEEYVPTAPTKIEKAVPAVSLASATPTLVEAERTENADDSLFPRVSDEMMPAIAVDAQKPTATSLPKIEPLPHPNVVLGTGSTYSSAPVAPQRGVPSLNIEDDELDDGFPSLRIENR